jgi:hypothetical protein
MQNYHSKTIRNINKHTMAKFKIKLNYESWDNIFGNDDIKDVDTLFNTFLNTYLQIFYSSFSLKNLQERINMANNWYKSFWSA